MADESRIKELEAAISEKDNKIKQLDDDLKTLTAKLVVSESDFERQISKIAEEQDKMNAEREAQIKALEIRIKMREDKIQELEGLLDEKKAVKELQDKNKILKSLNDKNKKEIDSINSENEKLRQEIEKLSNKLKGVKSIKELESIIEKKDGEIHELNLKLLDVAGIQSELKGEQDEIATAFEKQQTRIRELEEINTQQQQQITDLSVGLDAQKIQAYDNFVQQLQTELNEVKSQLTNSERLRGEQASSIEKFEAILGQIQEQIDEKEAAAAAAAANPPPIQAAQVPVMPPQPVQPHFTPAPPQLTPAQLGVPAPVRAPVPPAATSTDAPRAEAIKLLDSIISEINRGLSAPQIGAYMEEVRNKIVEVFQWHPTLFELAAFAKRLSDSPPGPVDPDNLAMLLDKINAWKKRILS